MDSGRRFRLKKLQTFDIYALVTESPVGLRGAFLLGPGDNTPQEFRIVESRGDVQPQLGGLGRELGYTPRSESELKVKQRGARFGRRLAKVLDFVNGKLKSDP